MLAARDSGVNTCNLHEMGSTTVRTVNGGGFVPDEGDIVFDEGVRRIKGWVGLCHSRFVLEVVTKMKAR